MQPVDYTTHQQPRAQAHAAALDDEMLSTAESFLLLAAFCTLATSIFSFSLI